MAEWYCAPGGQQIGPFGEERLREMFRAGQIAPEDAVWSPGMADWVPAGKVPGLLVAAPPPPPAAAIAPAAGAAVPVIPLSYARPADAPAPFDKLGTAPGMWPATFTAPEDDPGPFEPVGKLFKVNAARWTGRVVVSPKAFYLLKVAQRQDPGYGGVVGYMVANAINQTDSTRSCDLSQLPSVVARALDPAGRQVSGDVIIIRRDAVSRLKTSWMGVMTIRVGNDRFEITTPLFAGRRIRSFLKANDWTLNAKLRPTSAPSYTQPRGSAPLMPGGEKAFRIAAAVILILVLAFLKVGCSTNHRSY